MNTPGQLYIVATPIGNLKDMSLRALEILQQVDLIAAEDTRHSKVLLQHYGIKTPLISLHEHNEVQRGQALVEQLLKGGQIALISDAGTPLISDPGYHLVKMVREAGIRVIPIPGASALITALSVAGLATDRFCFEGFLSAKASARKQALSALLSETRTLIFYESPHRIMTTFKDMLLIFGPTRQGVIARELTKTFETIQSGTLSELNQWLAASPYHQRGEFVIILQGEQEDNRELHHPESQRILDILLTELPLKQAAQLTSKITGEKKNTLYAKAIKRQGV